MEIIHKGIPPSAFREDKGGGGGEGVELHTVGGLILYFCLSLAPYINGPTKARSTLSFQLKESPSLVHSRNGKSKDPSIKSRILYI